MSKSWQVACSKTLRGYDFSRIKDILIEEKSWTTPKGIHFDKVQAPKI